MTDGTATGILGRASRWCRGYARLIITALLLTYVGCTTNWHQVADAFSRLRLEFWLAALATLLVTQLLSAWRWQALARPFGFERTIRQMASYYFIGMYFNLLLPTSVGGDVVRVWYLDGGSGRRLAAFAAVFLDRFSGLVVLLSLACLGVALWPSALPAWISWFVWTTAGCAAAGIIATPLLTRKAVRLVKPQACSEASPYTKPGLFDNLHKRLVKLQLALKALSAPRLLLGSTLLSVGVQAGNVILVWLVGKSIAAGVPDGYYWIMVPMVSLLAMLPVSINGMGVREGATALFLAHLGIPDGTAKTLAFLWFAVFLTASLLGGGVYLFGHFPKPATRAAAPDEKDIDNGSVDCGADQGRTRQRQTVA